MSYKVIKFFTDIEDKDYPYKIGAVYPRKGLNVTKERIAQLMSSNNKQCAPLIIEEAEKKAAAKKAVDKVE